MKRLLILSLTTLLLSPAVFADQNENQIFKCTQTVDMVRSFRFLPDLVVLPNSGELVAEGSDYEAVLEDLNQQMYFALSKCINYKARYVHSSAPLTCKESKVKCLKVR